MKSEEGWQKRISERTFRIGDCSKRWNSINIWRELTKWFERIVCMHENLKENFSQKKKWRKFKNKRSQMLYGKAEQGNEKTNKI